MESLLAGYCSGNEIYFPKFHVVLLLTVLDAMGAEKAHFVGSEQTSVSVVYEFAGTKFTYKREGDIEAITTPGPIKDRVVVKVRWYSVFVIAAASTTLNNGSMRASVVN